MIDADYEDRWDAPANRWFATNPWYHYCWRPDLPHPRNLHTNLVAITGPGTAFDDEHVVRVQDLDPDTILFIDTADSGTHWMEPGDLHVDQVPPSIVRGIDGAGVHVAFADGSVWFLDADVPLADLKKFFTIAGARRYDREQVLAPYPVR
jgi:hypothetical protein